MTTSESNLDKWQAKLFHLVIQEYQKAEPMPEDVEPHLMSVIGRPEWYAIGNFSKNTETSNALYDAMHLFWGVYELWKNGHNQVAEFLQPEYEDLFLDWFEHLQNSHRVPYVPDRQDGVDNFEHLIIYAHIAAARSFRIRTGNELSEEVLDCLAEVERAIARLEAPSKGSGFFFDEAPSFYTSAGAILAMVFVELWRIRQAEGRHADALHYLAGAARYYEAASANFYGEYIDELWPEIAEEEHRWESRLQNLFAGLDVSAMEMVNSFQVIKSRTELVDDWVQVAQDCRAIADSNMRTWDFAELRVNDDDRVIAVSTSDSATGFDQIRDEVVVLNPEITDEDLGGFVTWSEFWHGAKAWATAQLSPSEYRKMRDDDEKYASETRLKNYFFGRDWLSLTERAQERLIRADETWNSSQRVSRESILNDLLRAVEEMCEQFLFQQFMNDERTASQILSIEAKVAENEIRSSLNVNDFISICELPSLRDALTERGLSGKEIEFLTQTLPTILRQLNTARGDAEHVTGTSAASQVVGSFYRGFLGIGRKGVLPELARIGRKLQRSSR